MSSVSAEKHAWSEYGRQAAVVHLQVLEDPKWPETWPFRPEDFLRYDEAPDGMFYEQPRFVYHIDDLAVKALTKWVWSAVGFFALVIPMWQVPLI